MVFQSRLLSFVGVLLASVLVALLSVVIGQDPSIIIVLLGGLIATLSFLMITAGKIKMFGYLSVYVVALVLSPVISLPGLPAVRLDDIWLLIGAAALSVMLLTRRIKLNSLKVFSPIQKRIIFMFLLILLWITFTITISVFKTPELYTHRDWFEVIKFGKYLLIFVLASTLALDSKRMWKFAEVVLFAVSISSILGLMQYFDFLDVNSWLTPLYADLDDERTLNSLVNQQRIVGTIGNPNAFAALMLIGLSIVGVKILNKAKIRHYLAFILFSVCLFLTLSRTGFVALAVLILFVIVLTALISKNKLSILMRLGLPFLLLLIGLQFVPEEFFWRIGLISNIENDNSFQARLDLWKFVWSNEVMNNMFVGTGPIKGEPYYYDNEWLQIIKTYGLIGLGLFVYLFVQMYRGMKNKIKLTEDLKIRMLSVSGRTMMIAMGVFMIPAVVIHQLQLMPLIVLFIGVIISYYPGKLEDTELEQTMD